jgi:hypothetical protein
MPNSTLASVTVPSLDAARSARERLARAGFARNSVDIQRHGNTFEVSIKTKEENQERAQRVLSGSILGNDMREAGARALDAFHGNRLLALGLAAIAGFAIFSFTHRR